MHVKSDIANMQFSASYKLAFGARGILQFAMIVMSSREVGAFGARATPQFAIKIVSSRKSGDDG